MSMGKTNPLRQQMINMMYLVLTALLALNVSSEILLAFRTLNNGMESTIVLLDTKKGQSMAAFEALIGKSAEARDFHAKALQVNKVCDNLYNYVDGIKQLIIKESKGMKWDEKEKDSVMVGFSDLETVTRLMVEQKKGDGLQDEIAKARKDLEAIVKTVSVINFDQFQSNILIKPETAKNDKKEDWAKERFNMVPVIAAVALLTKIQQDARTTQSNIIDALLGSIGKLDFKFNKLIPVVRVTTGKSAVSVGEKYEAEILLAAYDSTQQPKIFLGGRELEVKDGKALYVGSTGSQGSFDSPGEIVVTNKSTGEETKYPFRLAYDVFNAPAIISATKMNVLYIGLDNPVSISVPGYRPQDVIATMTAGTLTGVAGKAGDFTAKIPDTRGKDKIAIISVSVRTPDGGVRAVGKQEFRIKQVPTGTPFFGTLKNGDKAKTASLTLNNFIAVRLENFPYDLTYKVTKFKMLYKPKRGNFEDIIITGPSLNQRMKELCRGAQPGDLIIFYDIYASAPPFFPEKNCGAIMITVE